MQGELTDSRTALAKAGEENDRLSKASQDLTNQLAEAEKQRLRELEVVKNSLSTTESKLADAQSQHATLQSQVDGKTKEHQAATDKVRPNGPCYGST